MGIFKGSTALPKIYMGDNAIQKVYRGNVGIYDVLDPDVAAFVAKDTFSVTEEDALNDLVMGLKAANLWSKIINLYPMVGGTQTSCSIDLVAANSGVNDLSWYGTTSTFIGGFVGNGSQYAQRGGAVSLSDSMSPTNVGITIAQGLTGSVPTDECLFGVYGAGNSGVLFQLYSGGKFKLGNTSGFSPSPYKGVYTLTSDGATIAQFYSLGAYTNAPAGTLSLGGSGRKLSIGALNVSTLNQGYGAIGVNKRIQTFIIHERFNGTELSTLHGLINTFENALGRKTW